MIIQIDVAPGIFRTTDKNKVARNNMSSTLFPHGLAVWEVRTSFPDLEPSSEYQNVLARIGYHHLNEAAQQKILNTITVLLLFGSLVPMRDDRGRSLDYWRFIAMPDNIGHSIRLGFRGITGESDAGDWSNAMSSPGVDGSDVSYVYEGLSNNPSLYGNPFYHWQQVHRIWQSGGLQCPNCWREKMKIEAKFFQYLGDLTREVDDSDWVTGA